MDLLDYMLLVSILLVLCLLGYCCATFRVFLLINFV